MKCQQCGSEAVADAIFCQKCGARLDAPAAKAPASTSGEGRPPASSKVPDAPAVPANPLGRTRRGQDVPEEVLWEGDYSSKAMIGAWVMGGIISVALLVAAIIMYTQEFGVWTWLPLAGVVLLWGILLLQFLSNRLGVHYKLTNQRFFHQKGILRRVTNRIEVIDIDDVTYEQGIVDRMFGVGRIKITSSDRSDPELWLDGIENVTGVAGLIDTARRAERMRRGLHIESI